MRKILLFAMVLFFISNAAALSQINIYVDSQGNANFLGESDEESLDLPEGVVYNSGRVVGNTQELTSKTGSVWSFSYFLPNSEMNIFLPEGSTIVETNAESIFIEDSRIGIFVVDSAEVTYTVSAVSSGGASLLIPISVIAGALVLILVIYFLNVKRIDKIEKNEERLEKKMNKAEIVKDVLNDREKIIIDKLKETGKIKMSFLRKDCGIPKASFSRHVQELEKKGLVKRTGEGKNKFVELVE